MSRAVSLCVGLALIGCQSEEPDTTPEAGISDGSCDVDQLVGSFATMLQEEFTSVQGQVSSGIAPLRIPSLLEVDGSCQFFEPPILFCDPGCGAGTTCAADGTCIASPGAVSVGTVTVTGLSSPVTMTASSPIYFYTNREPLDHPGFTANSALQLSASGQPGASGADDISPFALDVRGSSVLIASTDAVSLDPDMPVVVEWDATNASESTTVHLDLNIAQHGGTPGWIECEVADTGHFEIPASLTNQLLERGFSGFPSLTLTRRSVDSISTAVGCVQWQAGSARTLDVNIAGLSSCSDDEDCPENEFCQADLTCGP